MSGDNQNPPERHFVVTLSCGFDAASPREAVEALIANIHAGYYFRVHDETTGEVWTVDSLTGDVEER
jgi:hypothetical protein